MENSLISLLVGSGLTLLGVIITNYLNRTNLLLQLKHQNSLEYQRVMRLKLEELRNLLNDYSLLINKYQNFTIQTHKELLDKKFQQETTMKLFDPISKLITMLTWYAPKALPQINKMQSSLSDYVYYAIGFQRKKHFDKSKLTEKFNILQNSISDILTTVDTVAVCHIFPELDPTNTDNILGLMKEMKVKKEIQEKYEE